jgi:transcriptional regulator with XRE-family HTH domain
VLISITKEIIMANLGSRIQELRKQKEMTQGALSKSIEISMTQLVRYENKGVQPPADVLKKLADVFAVSIDYLVNGNTTEKAENTLSDHKLLQHFKAVENMNEDDKSVVFKLIDAFITKKQIQKLAS